MKSSGYVNFKEMAARCELSYDELYELLEYGALPVFYVNSSGICFPLDCVGVAQKAAKIKRDYALDLFAMGVVMGFLQRIDDLELANMQLRTRLES